MGQKAVSFRDAEHAEDSGTGKICQCAAQKPLVEDELLFIAKYPKIAKELLTLIPLEMDL